MTEARGGLERNPSRLHASEKTQTAFERIRVYSKQKLFRENAKDFI